jgi:uncharacterized protein (UPF0335 family)
MTTKPKETPRREGDNSFAKGRLRDFFQRIERLNEDIEALNSDKSQVYQEAKAEGFDVTIMRVVLSRRKMDRADVQERDALVELYESALSGTKPATRARAREDGADE